MTSSSIHRILCQSLSRLRPTSFSCPFQMKSSFSIVAYVASFYSEREEERERSTLGCLDTTAMMLFSPREKKKEPFFFVLEIIQSCSASIASHVKCLAIFTRDESKNGPFFVLLPPFLATFVLCGPKLTTR